MRKETINILTAYMIAGSIVNIIILWVICDMPISETELVLTMAFTNACFIVFARDFAKSCEIKITKKIMKNSDMTEGAHTRGG